MNLLTIHAKCERINGASFEKTSRRHCWARSAAAISRDIGIITRSLRGVYAAPVEGLGMTDGVLFEFLRAHQELPDQL
jgi:hypothetical protein